MASWEVTNCSHQTVAPPRSIPGLETRSSLRPDLPSISEINLAGARALELSGLIATCFVLVRKFSYVSSFSIGNRGCCTYPSDPHPGCGLITVVSYCRFVIISIFDIV